MAQSEILQQLGHHQAKHTVTERGVVDDLMEGFSNSSAPLPQRLQCFPKHVRRQDIARFLTKYELFKQVLTVHGSIAECGVFAGGGLLSWLHFSSILEPYNHSRRIIGFDTFEGFPDVHEKDVSSGTSDHLKPKAFRISSTMKEEIAGVVACHDRNRPLGHIPKVELVEGNACKTIPEYIDRNPHTLLSLLYLDFDIYEPTKVALDTLWPRIVRGGIVAFDEANCADFPGETMALLESFDLKQVALQRTLMDPYISYFIKQ